MKPVCSRWVLAWMLTPWAASGALAEEQESRDGIFFGGAAGVGVPWVDHPDVSDAFRFGGYWALQVGWQLSPRLTLGGEFTTWGTSIVGTPVHLHTIGPRLELSTDRLVDGLFVGATAGLALTEGDLDARAGAGAALVGGYRWALGRWTSLAIEVGAHGHVYGDGAAAFPIAVLQLRFHGAH